MVKVKVVLNLTWSCFLIKTTHGQNGLNSEVV